MSAKIIDSIWTDCCILEYGKTNVAEFTLWQIDNKGYVCVVTNADGSMVAGELCLPVTPRWLHRNWKRDAKELAKWKACQVAVKAALCAKVLEVSEFPL
jgi:hypothetical protein